MIYWGRFFKDDGSVSVEFPDVPGVYTFGADLDEAKRMACEALNLFLSSVVDHGDALPSARRHRGTEFHAVEVDPSVLAAARIRQARKSAGLTQREMASRLGIAYQGYQKLEDARRSNPTLKSLSRIANVLGHTVEIVI